MHLSINKLFKIICALCLFGHTWVFSQSGSQTVTAYFVDPIIGSDQNDGLSVTTPFATILKARNSIRLINKGMTDNIIVFLKGGTYYIDTPIKLETLDSGFNGFNVIYTAYENEKPVISGAKKISGWTLHNASKNIYKVVLDSAMDFRQVYINGKRGVRARQPNMTDTVTFADYYTALSADPFVVKTSDIGYWNNLNSVECVWIAHWHEKRARISSIESHGDSAAIIFMQPEINSKVFGHATNDTYGRKNYYYFENAYEFIDSEGEWYLDNSVRTLYYKPRSGEDMSTAEVLIPVAENLITLTGTEGDIHNIGFYGITFEQSNWTQPNSFGYISWQAGLQLEPNNDKIVPGMVQLDYARDIDFERNIFRQSGSHGLVTVHNTSNIRITGNVFTDLAGGGIYINSAIGNGASKNDVISNNVVEWIGRVYSDCVGILATNVAGMTIRHNLVKYCPYTGISIGWSWDDTDKGAGDNDVSFNRIHHIMQLHDDGGGIYTLGRMPNSNFNNNYISSIVPSSYHGGFPFAGIYLDNGSCLKTVKNNVLDNTFSAFYAWNAPNHDNMIQDNFLNVNFGDVSKENTTGNNEFVRRSDWPASALSVMNNAGLEAEYSQIVSTEKETGTPPTQFTLYQNYPNPFNPSTVIEFSLPRDSRIKIEIFNVLGERIASLIDETRTKGDYKINFNPSNIGSGIYFCRLNAGDCIRTIKMIYLK